MSRRSNHMTPTPAFKSQDSARLILDDLIRDIGGLRVILLVVLSYLRPQQRRLTDAHDLSAHLRKDVGLPPRIEPPPYRGAFL